MAPISGSETSPVPASDSSADGTKVEPPTPILFARSDWSALSASGSSVFTGAPQLPQKFSSSATSALHSLQAGIVEFKNYESYCTRLACFLVMHARGVRTKQSFGKMKSEKSLAHDDFVAIIHRVAFTRFQSPPPVHERAIR